MSTILHVAPHPDDEILGGGATLELLRAGGWHVVNLACTLGRPADHDRRLGELLEAGRRSGFTTMLMDPLAALGGDDDLDRGELAVATAVEMALTSTKATLLMSPHPDDGHHAHEAVGRAVQRVLEHGTWRSLTWLAWGLWADLPKPNLYVPYGEETMASVMHSLRAYSGENTRNGYDRLYPARATAYSVLGSERIFGFGAARAADEPYADIFTAVAYDPDRRVLEPVLWRPGISGSATLTA